MACESKDLCCSCNIVHTDIVDNVKVNFPKEECLYDLAELFKVFGDPTRVKIIPKPPKNQIG